MMKRALVTLAPCALPMAPALASEGALGVKNRFEGDPFLLSASIQF